MVPRMRVLKSPTTEPKQGDPAPKGGENALSIASHVILPADMKEQVDALGMHHVDAREKSNV